MPDNKIEYPSPKLGEETYEEYHQRVRALKKKGFLLSGLTEIDRSRYCIGGGCRDNISETEIMKK